ncbi:MAG: DUF721 domain-containing protein [Chlorobi bacterium]|nr:DUF721 domain-containing protein [Chlorobiota bacterium]
MQKKEVQPLKKVVNEYLKALKIDGKIKKARLVNSYDKIVGKTIAKATNKVYFRDFTFVIEMNSSVMRNELYMLKEKLIQILNEAAGENLIEEIEFK